MAVLDIEQLEGIAALKRNREDGQKELSLEDNLKGMRDESEPFSGSDAMDFLVQSLDGEDYADIKENLWDELCITNDLEFSSERINILTPYIQKMVKDVHPEIKARVIILKRGTAESAFVDPLGNIFISQALINKLDSIDELVGVIAHEMGHLKNTTHQIVRSSSAANVLGISWMHEAAADLEALDFMAKAEVNTNAYAQLVNKFGEGRDFVHQSSGMRAIQAEGAHALRHYSTSDQEFTPLNLIFKGKVEPTNSEVVRKYLNRGMYGREDLIDHVVLREAFSKMSICDLDEISGNIPKRLNDLFINSFIHALRKHNCHLSREQYLLYVISRGESNYIYNSSKGAQELINLIVVIPDFLAAGTQDIVDKILHFHSRVKIDISYHNVKNIYTTMIDLIRSYSDIRDSGEVSIGNITLSQDEFIELIAAIPKVDYMEEELPQESPEHRYARDVAIIAYLYIEKYIISGQGYQMKEIDYQVLSDVLDKIKSKGVILDIEVIRAVILESILFYMNKNTNLKDFNKIYSLFVEKFGKPDDNRILQEEAEVMDPHEEVDKFFETIVQIEALDDRSKAFIDFLMDFKRKTSREALEELIPYILSKCETIPYTNPLNMESFLVDNNSAGSTEDVERNRALALFNLKLTTLIGLSSEDDDTFYDRLESLLYESQDLFEGLSKAALLNLLSPLFYSTEPSSYNRVTYGVLYYFGNKYGAGRGISVIGIKNWRRFEQLGIIQKLLNMHELPEDASPIEVIRYIQSIFLSLHSNHNSDISSFIGRPSLGSTGCFSTFPVAMIIFKEARERALELLNRLEAGDLSVTVSSDMLYLLQHYVLPKSPRGRSASKFIAMNILNNQGGFKSKLAYLYDPYYPNNMQTLDILGYEGIEAVAASITTIDELMEFRAALGWAYKGKLGPNGRTKELAAVDFITSFLSADYEWVLSSSVAGETGKDITLALIGAWIKSYLTTTKDSPGNDGVIYDPSKKKVVLDQNEPDRFLSISDIIETLHDLGITERFALVGKSLGDQSGAFSTEEERVNFAGIVGEILKPNSFISALIYDLCITADREVATIPLGFMLAPLLFKGMDLSQVSVDDITPLMPVPNNTGLTPEDVLELVNKSAEDIASLGKEYTGTNSVFFVEESERINKNYVEAKAIIDKIITRDSKDKDVVEDSADGVVKLDPGLEAIIQGIQVSGGIEVWSAQQLVLFEQFEPTLTRRLEQLRDANPGLSRLWFLDNLAIMYELGETNPDYAPYRELLNRKNFKIGEKLGGGSLYTTYAASYEDDNGQRVEIVLKMQNPNAASNVTKHYALWEKAFKRMINEDAGKNVKLAKLGLLLIEYGRERCLADLNDVNFAQMDDVFRLTIESFNQTHNGGVMVIQAPSLELRHPNSRLRSERRAYHTTLNKLAHDETVPLSDRKQIVKMLYDFCLYQLDTPAYSDGRRMIHSDIHSGNFLLDIKGDNDYVINVIDRHMYQVLSPKEAGAFKLLAADDRTGFLNAFLDAVFDDVGIASSIRRTFIKAKIGASLRNSKEGILETLQKIFGTLTDLEIRVPLRLLLEARNILGLKIEMEKLEAEG